MATHQNRIPQDLIEGAVNHAFDPNRSQSENIDRMKDYLAQFTGPLGRDEDTSLEFALDDEIARRRAYNWSPFN